MHVYNHEVNEDEVEEEQTEDEAVAEDEAAFEDQTKTGKRDGSGP